MPSRRERFSKGAKAAKRAKHEERYNKVGMAEMQQALIDMALSETGRKQLESEGVIPEEFVEELKQKIGGKNATNSSSDGREAP